MPTQPRTMPGVLELLPPEQVAFQSMLDTIRRGFELYGFVPVETPAIEFSDVLLTKTGGETERQVYFVQSTGALEQGEKPDLALRFDLTVPLARYVAEHEHDLAFPFRRYQMQRVYRGERAQRGRFREFYQCDIDAIGSTSPIVEVELLAAVSEVLTRLGFRDFVVRLNDRRLLAALMELCAVAPERYADVLVSIDKLDKIGRDAVRQDLLQRGIDAGAADKLLDAFTVGSAASSDDLARAAGASETGKAAVESLREIVTACAGTAAAGRVKLDPSLARGLSYYTGAIMEIAVPDLAGSLGGGGRYDNLIGMFLGRDVPACGFSLGLERIIVVMTERGMFPGAVARGAADVMVALWNESSRGDAIALARELRAGRLRTEVYPDPDKLGKQFKYASSRKFPYVAIVGDDERASGTVAVKNLATGAQEAMPRADAADYIRRQLSQA